MNISTYFAKRRKTYPQSIKGKFRTIRNISGYIFLAIYFFSPFIRWQRGENIPDQAILIDIVGGRIYYFFIEIWPQEVYYIAGLLIFAAIALFFVTSLFGRVWCGYSCPQTVWTDLFLKVEKLFQGTRNQRILLDRKPLSLSKLARKGATHITWLLIGLVTGFGFTLYFNDAFVTVKQLVNFDLSFAIISWTLGIASMTYIMAGFAREQVCNHMCPYSRFQSVMFDKDTLIISYDQQRGEPRAKYKKGTSFEDRGHCISCNQCVVVCPQDIDIRNGLQMECIACGMCVDACDEVMGKVGLPPGLIRYDTDHNMENTDKNKNSSFKILRLRTLYYITVLLIVGGLILFHLSSRAVLELSTLPDRNPLFVTLSDGGIRNGYTIKIYNKTHQSRTYSLKVTGVDDYLLKVQGVSDLSINYLPIDADNVGSFKIYLTANPNYLDNNDGKNDISFTVIDNQSGETASHDSVFISR